MDKTTTDKMPIFSSERFRTPFSAERALGLWVDRIGRARVRFSSVPEKLRLLGLHGAVFIEDGSGYFISGAAKPLKVDAGTVLLLFPDMPHAYYPDRAWTTRWIVWGGPESEILREKGYCSSDISVIFDKGEAFSRAFGSLAQVMADESLGAVLKRKTVLLQMLLDLYNESRSSDSEVYYEDRIKKAIQFIRDHAAADIRITDIAAQFSMSTTHFRRLFKRHTGRSPLQYQIQLRVSKAKQLLAEGRSIKETARAAGYNDVFYFMRVFKKYTGVPPGRFADMETIPFFS